MELLFSFFIWPCGWCYCWSVRSPGEAKAGGVKPSDLFTSYFHASLCSRVLELNVYFACLFCIYHSKHTNGLRICIDIILLRHAVQSRQHSSIFSVLLEAKKAKARRGARRTALATHACPGCLPFPYFSFLFSLIKTSLTLASPALCSLVVVLSILLCQACRASLLLGSILTVPIPALFGQRTDNGDTRRGWVVHNLLGNFG